MKENVKVYGMTCQACSNAVMNAVLKVDGVTDCNVNLLTNSMDVVYENIDVNIIKLAVKKAGYKTDDDSSEASSWSYERCLLSSLIFMIPMMYLAMSSMLNLPIFDFFNNTLLSAFTQFLLLIPIVFINRDYFVRGFKNLIKLHPNMDSLISIGSSSSIIYGVYAIYKMILDSTIDFALYFESAAMILVLIRLGKIMESRSKSKTKDELESLTKLAPKSARVILDGKETEVPVEKCKVDDIVIVKPGEVIPLDGIIVSGNGLIDEKTITGESIPVYKKNGDEVYSSTINLNHSFNLKVTKNSSESSISEIIKLVTNAANSKPKLALIVDVVSKYFVYFVMTISLISLVVWYIITKDLELSLQFFISVLVVSCPCALGLATPVAVMVSTGLAAKNNLLVKDAKFFEVGKKVNAVVFDKTNTLTNGKPEVTDFYEFETNTLQVIASLEAKSGHPLSIAINNYAKKMMVTPIEVTEFTNIDGVGISAKVNDIVYYITNVQFLNSLTNSHTELINKHTVEGKTPMILSANEKVLAMIFVRDNLKPTSVDTVKSLHELGIKTYLLTGDNLNTANAIGKELNITNIIAEVKPDQKAQIIEDLKVDNIVCMVGDGVNDAIALKTAHVAISLTSGSDVAKDTADVLVLSDDMLEVYNFIKLSKSTLRIMKENLFWAFLYNTIGIFIASGCLYHYGIKLTPMLASLAMSISSVTVVLNALRINSCKLKKTKEKMKMKLELTVPDMMCKHCKKNIEEAVLKLGNVISVDADYTTKKVSIEGSDLNKEEVANIITALDFKVL